MKVIGKLISAVAIGLAVIGSPVALAEDGAKEEAGAGAGASGGIGVGTAVALGVLGVAIIVEANDDGPSVSPPSRPDTTVPPTTTATTTATATSTGT